MPFEVLLGPDHGFVSVVDGDGHGFGERVVGWSEIGCVTHQHMPGTTLGDGAGLVEARVAVGPNDHTRNGIDLSNR